LILAAARLNKPIFEPILYHFLAETFVMPTAHIRIDSLGQTNAVSFWFCEYTGRVVVGYGQRRSWCPADRAFAGSAGKMELL
jgi:hypothetical protein